jgi:hypothetical protein
MLERFLESMRVKNFSEATVEHRAFYAQPFIRWCRERGLSRPNEITNPILDRYQRYLFHYRKTNGQPISFRTQQHHLVVFAGPSKAARRDVVRCPAITAATSRSCRAMSAAIRRIRAAVGGGSFRLFPTPRRSSFFDLQDAIWCTAVELFPRFLVSCALTCASSLKTNRA